MKQLYLKTFVLCLFMLQTTIIMAYHFANNGIYYNVNNDVAIVTYPNSRMLSADRSNYQGEIVIPSRVSYNNKTYEVKEIGSMAFYRSSVTKVTLPATITKIGQSAFNGCSELTSINLPDNVEVIELTAFSGTIKLTEPLMNRHFFVYMPASVCNGSYTIPEGISEVYADAFLGCTGLTSITLPKSLKKIGASAFQNCSGITEVVLPDSLNDIGYMSFRGCTNLKRVTLNCNACVSKDWAAASNYGLASNLFGSEVTEYILGENITAIGNFFFTNCTSIPSIALPKRLKRIGKNAFAGCTSIKSIEIPDSVTIINDYAFRDCSCLSNVNLSESLYSLGIGTFLNCSSLSSIVIPNSVQKVGLVAFDGTAIKTPIYNDNIFFYLPTDYVGSYAVPNGIKYIGNGAFYKCSNLESVTLPKSLKEIRDDAFSYCTKLQMITLPDSVYTIAQSSFLGCSALSKINLSVYLRTIGSQAFYNCNSLENIELPDNITSLYNNSLGIAKPFVKRGTPSMLMLWRTRYNAYEKVTGKLLEPSKFEVVSTTQTTATIKAGGEVYEELEYICNGQKMVNYISTVKGLMPGTKKTISVGMRTTVNTVTWGATVEVTPQSLMPEINITPTATSLTAVGSYAKGDANVTAQKIIVGNMSVEDSIATLNKLDPNTSYKVEYVITITEGWSTQTFTSTKDVTTEQLIMTPQQPKVISDGNVIVAAKTNIDDEEPNVGFEWRRTDWTDDFDSKSGNAYLYDGMMEGYIRSINSNYLWKFRPFYTSNSGNTYYGDWKGMDPSDYSYFEPTVYTYATINVTGNRAEVKGYAMRGTDKITSQGFMFWPNTSSYSSRKRTPSIPTNAVTIEVSGNIMIAALEGLEYETPYCYVAFVKTEENEMFFGEVQTFKTDEDIQGIIDGISDVEHSLSSIKHSDNIWYDLNGRRLTAPQKGINIIRMSDGTVKKVLVK
ncbi:MAG: leucine-rich repeat domain-containing protein [Bacteroidaceae bacterium]|nr:leucine-rich repeat domain-containing protein [Bacteroidaceae bacterium]